MDIKSRKDAMACGDNTYFTGNPCKNGHINYRYVQSGACYDCLRSLNYKGSNESPTAIARQVRLKEMSEAIYKKEADRQEFIETMRIKSKAKENLVILKLRLFPSERESLAAYAYALAAMRYPMLTIADIDPRLPTVGKEEAGTLVYQFYCHADDVAALRAAMNDSFKKYQPNIDQLRQRVFSSAAKQHAEENPDTTPPMSFK